MDYNHTVITMLDSSDLPIEVMEYIKKQFDDVADSKPDSMLLIYPVRNTPHAEHLVGLAGIADGLVLTYTDDMHDHEIETIYVSFNSGWHQVIKYDKMNRFLNYVESELKQCYYVAALKSVSEKIDELGFRGDFGDYD